MGWGQSCRLRHVTSGRYLAATADNQVVTYHRGAATEEATAFRLRESKVRVFLSTRRRDIGAPVYGRGYPFDATKSKLCLKREHKQYLARCVSLDHLKLCHKYKKG